MKLILHGGGNSLAEVERAHALGLSLVEADVMLCFQEGVYDGALCVHPRGRLPRRTAAGHLAYGRAEAQARCGDAPTLEALLDALRARGMAALIECKVAGTIERIAPLLAGTPVTVISFLGSELCAAAGLSRGCLIKHDPAPPVWRALHDSYRFALYAPDHWYLSPETVALARAAGVMVAPWDVDERAHAERLAAMGVEALITNEPEALL